MTNVRTLFFLLLAVLLCLTTVDQARADVYPSFVRITQEGSADPFDGDFTDLTGAAIRFYLNDAADSVVIDIAPAGGGAAVKRLVGYSLSAGDNVIIWDGSQNDGSPAPVDSYALDLTAYSAGYSVYTQYFIDTPAIFTRGVGSVNNPALRWFGFIYAASNGGYVTGVARHAPDGTQYGDVPGDASLATTGEAVGPQNRRYATTIDDEGYAYLIGRDEGRIFRYHIDTLDVQLFDSSAYGTIIQGLDVRGTGANKYLYVTGDSAVFGIPIGTQSFNTVTPEVLVSMGPDTGKGLLFWDAELGEDSSLYVLFRADSAIGPYTTRPRGVFKFDLNTGSTPKYVADTVWTGSMADGDPVTVSLWDGGPGASDDILYMSHDVGSPNTERSGVYAWSNLDAASPTRTLAWDDTDNNTTSFRGAVVVDAVGNVVYFENSNEQTVLISPPTGPNSYTYTALDQVTVTTPGVAPPLITIAEARVDLNDDNQPDRLGDTVKVLGVVNSTNVQTTNFGYFMQDDNAGIQIFQFGLVGAPALKPGDRVLVYGIVAYFRGTTEISPIDLATDIIVVDTGNVITPIPLTIDQYRADPEMYESRSFELAVANPAGFDVSGWPAAGSSANLSIWGGGRDSTILRVDSDTPVSGSPYPTFPVMLKGIGSQFTSSSSVHDDGYQITPFFVSDFTPVDAPPARYFPLLSPANNATWSVADAGSYDFTWRKAVDFNGDNVIYQFQPVGFTGSGSNNAGADTVKTLTGATLLGYLGANDSLVLQWTVLAKDPANPPVANLDTFLVTIKRAPVPPAGWTSQTSGVTTALYSVETVSQQIAWTAGVGGTVLRTTDAGNNWTSVGGGNIGTMDLYAVEAIDQNTAFTTGSAAAGSWIFRTTNGGSSWDTVYFQAGGFINAIHMMDATNGVAAGDPVGGKWTVVTTTDGGASWARIANEPAQVGTEAGANNGLAVVGNNHIWFSPGSGGPRVYRSADGGASWSSSDLPFTSFTGGLAFSDTLYGVAGGSNGAAARTTDGGATWTSVTVTGAGPIYGMSGSGLDFFASRGQTVARSTDRGATWSTSYAGGVGDLNDVGFVSYGSSTSGWTVGNTGGIAGFFGTVTGVGDGEREVIPQSFALDQNYPNPFNPSTTIRYSLPTQSAVSLSIYNVLGQKVASLVDEVKSAGVFEVVWNGKNQFGSQIASGVYFYRLEARPSQGGEPFTMFKKMILLK